MGASHRHDVVVISAGIVGTACCYCLARAGLKVAVIERVAVAAGATGAGEGSVLPRPPFGDRFPTQGCPGCMPAA